MKKTRRKKFRLKLLKYFKKESKKPLIPIRLVKKRQ